MRRRIFGLAAAVSLLLCLGAAVLWVRSVRTPYSVTRYTIGEDSKWVWGREFQFWSDSGRLSVCVVDEGASPDQKDVVEKKYRPWAAGGWRWVAGKDTDSNSFDSYDPYFFVDLISKTDLHIAPYPIFAVQDSHHEWLGFRIANSRQDMLQSYQFLRVRLVTVPYWFLILFLIVMPALWGITAIRKWKRKKRSACVMCGYSLTGNTSGICPECGTPCTTSGSRVDEISAVSQGET